LGTDRLRERLLQSRKVIRMYPAFEYLERHRIYFKIDIEHAVAFARCSREQSPRVPAIATHPADLLALDHPQISLAQRFEKLRRFEGDSSLRSQHRYYRDALWCERILPLGLQVKEADRSLLMNQRQAQLGDASWRRIIGTDERRFPAVDLPDHDLLPDKDP